MCAADFGVLSAGQLRIAGGADSGSGNKRRQAQPPVIEFMEVRCLDSGRATRDAFRRAVSRNSPPAAASRYGPYAVPIPCILNDAQLERYSAGSRREPIGDGRVVAARARFGSR